MKALVATFVALACCTGTAAAQLPATGPDPTPYGTDDAGGFRNVLPPGSNGLDNFTDFLHYQADGTRPPHFDDQLKLYTDLLYASPKLTPNAEPSAAGLAVMYAGGKILWTAS